jgi:glycosyltransferase involved in cell wall biosynthesis
MSKKLLSLYLPHMYGNGLDRVVLNLAKSFVDFGFNVDLVTPEVTEYQRQTTQSLPAQVRNIGLDVSVTKSIVFKKVIKKIIKLSQYLKEAKPTIFLANNDYIGVSNLAKLIAGSSTKVVEGVHINVSQYFSNLSGLRGTVRPFLLKQVYRNSDGIIAVSQGVADDIAQLLNVPVEQIKVIYNPVVTPDLQLKAREPVNHSWFTAHEPPVILGAGRLMHQKGYPTLIRAFAQVRKQHPSRLVIIGNETAFKAELETLAHSLGVAEDISMPGFKENPYAYMANADIFVMSSEYEGFGNVLVEAMATGTPVVSTDCESGPAEILECGKYGQLVPVGDANKLAEAILATLANPLDSQVLQQRAQDFTTEAIAREYLTYFEELIN